MPREIAEADWKVFRQLQPVALERFCQRVLSEAARLASQSDRGSHERYLALFDLLKRRDKEVADAFNNPRRSAALLQLALLRRHELLSDDEFARFGPGARQTVQTWLEFWRS
jgi:hypothetical protein